MSGFGPVVPRRVVTFYDAGDVCTEPQAGDILLVEQGTAMSHMIGFGQRVAALYDDSLRPFAWCHHTAFLRVDGVVSEMGPRGHELRPLAHYSAVRYAVVRFVEVTPEQVEAALGFDLALHGTRYGWTQYPPLALDCLTGARWGAAWGSTMICSTHVSMVAAPLGLLPDRQPGGVMPVHLAKYLGARPD